MVEEVKTDPVVADANAAAAGENGGAAAAHDVEYATEETKAAVS